MIQDKVVRAPAGYRLRVGLWKHPVLLALVGGLLLGPGCAECDSVSDCEDACDEAFGMDEVRRDGCYINCANRDYECNEFRAADDDPARSS